MISAKPKGGEYFFLLHCLWLLPYPLLPFAWPYETLMFYLQMLIYYLLYPSDGVKLHTVPSGKLSGKVLHECGQTREASALASPNLSAQGLP